MEAETYETSAESSGRGAGVAERAAMTYIELQALTHFSFLRGVSSAEEMFAAAARLGYPALGIADWNSVGGLVKALRAADETGVRLIAGCRLELMDGSGLLVWPEDRAGWSRLTRLLTLGKSRVDRRKGEKGQCFLHWEDVAAWSGGLVAALVPDEPDPATEVALAQMADIFGDRAHLALTRRRRPGDLARLHALETMARRFGVRGLATGDVLYDSPDKRMLQDVVTAIRHKCTIDELGFRRERFADRHLKSPAEMERRFRDRPDSIRASADIAQRCSFSLRELSYQYPDEIVMSGRSPQEALERLARAALAERYPQGPPKSHSDLLEKELKLVAKLEYAPYFLTVNSVVEFARSQQILCQGRGSAANSMICFLLGITSIDPVKHTLLFERFISESRDEPPDIDVDFEHERREEVIQWIYENYGHSHAALTAVVSRYRTRGAVREVGKALGLPEDLTSLLSSQVWGWSGNGVPERHVEELGLDLKDPRLALTLELTRQLVGTPRHLSQHPGGFVLTRDRLDELVPIEPAAMEDRWVIEWEKDDLEELRIMKLDVLGLGMLGCMRRAFDLLAGHKGLRLTLEAPVLQEDDPAVYAMIRKADTIGVFQIESRAQMSMLPRMKPVNFYDIVIQVAIVRPGPIQGDMVHPYLRRREGKEKIEYPSEALRAVLEKTLGVPLFQEQAMNVAIVGAGFTPAEADRLRRSMATFKSTGGVSDFEGQMIGGMVERGYTRDFAERTFRQIEGFGSYGFPESHAASFAKIAYASSWMKCHHPDIFCAAILNAQPMGFYQPAQLVRDAREHGVEVRPVCVNASRWDCTLEGEGTSSSPSAQRMGRGTMRSMVEGPSESASPSTALRAVPLPTGSARGEDESPLLPLRLGLRLVRGLSNLHAARILAARADTPFASIEDVWRRSGVPAAALEKLADADAFRSLGLDRRQALWRVRGLGEAPLPLFAAADAAGTEPEVALVPLTGGREVVEDYRTVQLSLREHPLAFLRGELERRRMVSCAGLARMKDGARVELAGIVLIRQRPGKGNVTFITLEDETGIANVILWQRRFEEQRRIVMGAAMIGVKGILQREGEVTHVVADRLEDLTGLLYSVADREFPHRFAPADGGKGAASDPREAKRARELPRAPSRPDQETVIRVKSRNFH
jgi:error-prone DNA polymerase